MWCVQGFGFPVCSLSLTYLRPNSSGNPMGIRRSNMNSFNKFTCDAICKNKILAKIFEFTVYL